MSVVYIYIDKGVILSNKQRGENKPPITISFNRAGDTDIQCHGVKINGPCDVVYSGPTEPVKGIGAHVAIVIDTSATTFEVIRNDD